MAKVSGVLAGRGQERGASEAGQEAWGCSLRGSAGSGQVRGLKPDPCKHSQLHSRN